jgi:hypothetical protein
MPAALWKDDRVRLGHGGQVLVVRVAAGAQAVAVGYVDGVKRQDRQ